MNLFRSFRYLFLWCFFYHNFLIRIFIKISYYYCSCNII